MAKARPERPCILRRSHQSSGLMTSAARRHLVARRRSVTAEAGRMSARTRWDRERYTALRLPVTNGTGDPGVSRVIECPSERLKAWEAFHRSGLRVRMT